MTTSLPLPPRIHPDHRFLTDATQALRLGYWVAEDAAGYEYAVGTAVRGTSAESTDVQGNRRTWDREGRGGEWKETTPDRVSSTFESDLPERHRKGTAWALPDGTEPDRAGRRGPVLSGLRNWCDRLRGVGKSLGYNERLVWIHGAPGCGKTQALAWMLRDLASHGRDVSLLSLPDLIVRLRATYGSKDEAARAELHAEVDRAVTCGVLGLDDLGAESGGEDTRAILYRILDRRLTNDLPTVATSNLQPGDLSSWDDRLRSRASAFRVVELPGRDYRDNQPRLV